MDWPNARWVEQSSPAAQLAMLERHIGDLSSYLRADMSSAPGSVQYSTIHAELESLRAERDRLARIVRGASFTRGVAI